MRNYRVILRKEPEGVYTAFVPAFTSCITWGETVEHALEMAKDAIEGCIEILKEEGLPIPLGEKRLNQKALFIAF
jgi:antitoxin HicB